MGPENTKKGILQGAVKKALPPKTTPERFPAVQVRAKDGTSQPASGVGAYNQSLMSPGVSTTAKAGPKIPSSPSMTTAQSTPALPKSVQQAKVANPTALAAGKGKKLGLLKKTIEPLKRDNSPKPLKLPKQLPLRRLPKMPVKPKMPTSPAPFKPGYKPGSHLRGYTKFA